MALLAELVRATAHQQKPQLQAAGLLQPQNNMSKVLWDLHCWIDNPLGRYLPECSKSANQPNSNSFIRKFTDKTSNTQFLTEVPPR